jgi:hypothetical protein
MLPKRHSTPLKITGLGKSRLVAKFEEQLPKEVTIWHGHRLPYGDNKG